MNVADVQTLLDSAAPAVLETTKANGEATMSPVWFRFHNDAFEIVITNADPKAKHLVRNPRCALVVFETERPFRGVKFEGTATTSPDGVFDARLAIALKYLGPIDGPKFTGARSPDAIVVRLAAAHARSWDLTRILP
jgi:Pyridoxamine 5'-phosphate oxidase